MSDLLSPEALARALADTAVREHMTVEQAVATQFRLVDAIQRELGSDDIFTEDYGQVRALATGPFGSGGRPYATARVERALAEFLGVEDVVLVHGAGTGSIRAALTSVPPRGRILLHRALPYKTTASAVHRLGLSVQDANFNDLNEVRAAIERHSPDVLYIQHVPHQAGDVYELSEVVSAARAVAGDGLVVLVDDNYAAMRTPQLGVHLGADASAFSLFKLLARANVGCVAGTQAVTHGVRAELASAGSQVQGPDAMDALRSLVYAPVALAVQNNVVIEAAAEINRLIDTGALPYLLRAIPAQVSMRSIALVFTVPIAEAFLAAAWRNGSPSRSVGEEARYDLVPLFTYLAGTFIKGMPGIERFVIRVNPLRGGTEAIVRVLKAALADAELAQQAEQLAAAA
jgi:hypothetical protein